MECDDRYIETSVSVTERALLELTIMNIDFNDGDITVIANQLGSFHATVNPRTLHRDKYIVFLKEFVIRSYYYSRATDCYNYRNIVCQIIQNDKPKHLLDYSKKYWLYISNVSVTKENKRMFLKGQNPFLYILLNVWTNLNRTLITLTPDVVDVADPLYDLIIVHSMVLMRKIMFFGDDYGRMVYNKACIIAFYVYALCAIHLFNGSEWIFNHEIILAVNKLSESNISFLLERCAKPCLWQTDSVRIRCNHILKKWEPEVADLFYNTGVGQTTRTGLLMLLLSVKISKQTIRDRKLGNIATNQFSGMDHMYNSVGYVGDLIKRHVYITRDDIRMAISDSGNLIPDDGSYVSPLLGFV